MPATVSHVLSMTTPDDLAYENKPSNWNSGHNVTLNILATEISALFSNKNGVSFGLDGTNITGSIAAGGAPGSISAGTTNVALGEVVFANSNGVSFGLNGATVTATVQTNYLTTAMLSNAATISNIRVSAGTTSNLLSALTFADSNGISFGINAGTVTAQHNALTSQSNQAISGQNGSSTFQTISFGNANGISFGTDAAGFTASHNALTSQSNQAFSAAGGSSAFQTLSFSNNEFASWTNNAGQVAVTELRGSFFATGNTTQSSSGTINLDTLIFRGSGVASVGVSNGSVIVDVPAGGGGITNINVSAGTTSNNLSNLVFSNSNGMEFGLNGSTITARDSVWLSQWPMMWATAAQSKNSGTSGGTGASTQFTVSVNLHPVLIEHNLTFNEVAMVMSGQTVAGTGSASVGYMVGIYSLNQSTALSLISSAQFVAVVSQNSVTARTASWWWGTNSTSNSSSLSGNVSASFTAARRFIISTGGNSLSKGQYWIGFCHTGRTSGANINSSNSIAGLTAYQQPSVSMFGTNANLGSYQLNGAVSTTSNMSNTGMPIMPASINTSALTSQNVGSTAEHIVFRSNQ